MKIQIDTDEAYPVFSIAEGIGVTCEVDARVVARWRKVIAAYDKVRDEMDKVQAKHDK
jgi:hypothetical protein